MKGAMNWIKVLSQDELPEGGRRVVEVGGRDILLLHHGGQIYAIDNNCPHMGAPLEGGKLTEDEAIVCPRHHSRFDLRTGKIKEWAPWPPAVGRVLGAISREKPLPVFPTRIEQGGIWVGLEQPQ
jgi:nitrite reductase/ring-hydroxylating ferredoxin subunit